MFEIELFSKKTHKSKIQKKQYFFFFLIILFLAELQGFEFKDNVETTEEIFTRHVFKIFDIDLDSQHNFLDFNITKEIATKTLSSENKNDPQLSPPVNMTNHHQMAIAECESCMTINDDPHWANLFQLFLNKNIKDKEKLLCMQILALRLVSPVYISNENLVTKMEWFFFFFFSNNFQKKNEKFTLVNCYI
jgi:hypothetical protein